MKPKKKKKVKKVTKGRLKKGPQMKCTCSWIKTGKSLFLHAQDCIIHNVLMQHGASKCVPVEEWFKLWTLAAKMNMDFEFASTMKKRTDVAILYSKKLIRLQKAMDKRVELKPSKKKK